PRPWSPTSGPKSFRRTRVDGRHLGGPQFHARASAPQVHTIACSKRTGRAASAEDYLRKTRYRSRNDLVHANRCFEQKSRIIWVSTSVPVQRAYATLAGRIGLDIKTRPERLCRQTVHGGLQALTGMADRLVKEAWAHNSVCLYHR